MKNITYPLSILLLLVSVWSLAQAPKTLSYQGNLSDGGGPLNGSYNLTFTIYDAASGGTNLWTETSDSVAISGGNVSLTLGKITPINVQIDKPLWMGIIVGGNPEISPRVELTGSLYSLGMALPFTGSSNSSSNSFEITNTGIGGSAARFANNNASNTNPTILINNQSGTGNAITANAPIEATQFIGGSLQITSGTPGAGKVLTSDSMGVASWATPSTMPDGTASGEMMYWNGSAWVSVPPGTNGQNLTFCNGMPVWGICPATLTVVKAGTGMGTIVSTPAGINCGVDCVESYNAGTPVTLTAAPSAGSTFTGWSGGGCSGTGTCVATMNTATTVTATFTPIQFSLTVAKAGTGNGTVTSSPSGINCGGDCTEPYNSGTVVTLTAAPDSISTFTGWTGGGCSGTGTCNVTLGSTTTVTATFSSSIQNSLTVVKAGTGVGTVTSSPAGINCGADCAESYNAGTPVTLTAAPSAGSTFTGWSGGGCSGTGTCVATMNTAMTVTATFTPIQFSLTVAKAGTGNGTVTSSPSGINCGGDCTELYNSGTVVTLTAVASAGSTFTGWSGGGCSGTGTCVATMNTAMTVTATFTPIQFSLTVAKAGTGNGTVTSSPSGINCGGDCTELYNSGTVVTLTAAPDSISTFTGWTGGGCSGTGTCNVTLGSTTTVTATFSSSIQNSLTVVKAGTGVGTVTSSPAGINCGADCAELYNSGTVVTLTAVASAGSTFTGWSGGGCSGTGTCVATMNTAMTVTATFTPIQFSLTVAKAGTGNGTVTSSPSGINCGGDCTELYNSGTVVTLTAVASAGSTFTGWSGGGCSGTGTCVTSMNTAMTVTATFTLSQFLLSVVETGTGAGTVTSNLAGINCPGDCSEPYNSGTLVTLTAVPSAGSIFSGWSGGGCSGTGTCVAAMNSATTVTATFTPIQFSLTVAKAGTAAGIGTVTSSPAGINCGGDCTEAYNSGTMITLTAVPGSGSSFLGWSGGGCAGTGTCNVTLGTSTTVTATFQ